MLALALLVAGIWTHAPAADTKPLNVVLLNADDWRFDTLGCAGNPVVTTPNLDRLAGQGFRFTQNCVTTSICGVCRASLSTNDDVTLNVDLAATILAAVGIAAPTTMQGRDIAPLHLATDKPARRTGFFYEQGMLQSKDFIPASRRSYEKTGSISIGPASGWSSSSMSPPIRSERTTSLGIPRRRPASPGCGPASPS